ncbi:ankyrin-1-like [Setaria italica]|uniref:ankyrin-1-like n=1 Tax=Setaria italica TaxID=4555 RepID=UPI000BE600D8|nr:ankyrin-1-like [Setaria italica]
MTKEILVQQYGIIERHCTFIASSWAIFRQLQEILTGNNKQGEAAPPPRAPHEVVIDVASSSSSSEADADAAPAVTEDADSALHVAAAAGDGGRYLESAAVICGRARRLLGARNGGGDTPLHCAAPAGHARMVARLIGLARGEDGGDEAAARAALLRMRNARGETALHEAVRFGGDEMVAALVGADGELARVVAGDGTSSLYLASTWGRHQMAREMHDKDRGLSYSGPDGQNALHAAVLHDDRGAQSFFLQRGILDRIVEREDLNMVQEPNGTYIPTKMARAI